MLEEKVRNAKISLFSPDRFAAAKTGDAAVSSGSAEKTVYAIETAVRILDS